MDTHIRVYMYILEELVCCRRMMGGAPKFVALGRPLLGHSLKPNESPSLGPLWGLSVPSEARHARSEATSFVTADCT